MLQDSKARELGLNKHSPTAPSAAHRWVNCPGSVNYVKQLPEPPTSDDSIAGTASHWVAAQLLTVPSNWSDYVGEVCPDTDTVIDEEQAECADFYASYVLQLADETNTTDAIKSEVFVWANETIGYSLYGTCDTFLFDNDNNTLHVLDYKFGHRTVDAKDNYQLIAYTVAIIESHLRFNDPRLQVKFHIVQPRAFRAGGPIRTHEYTVAELQPHFDRLKQAWDEAQLPEARCIPGLWCRDCVGLVDCNASRRYVYDGADYIDRAEVVDITPEVVANELRLLSRISEAVKHKITALEASATALLKKGVDVPGYELQKKIGRLDWSIKPEEVIAIGDLMGVDLRHPVAKTITPTQAKKVIDEAVINGYAHKPDRGVSLSEVSTKTSSIIFNKVK
jgi:hypothetical protein